METRIALKLAVSAYLGAFHHVGRVGTVSRLKTRVSDKRHHSR